MIAALVREGNAWARHKAEAIMEKEMEIIEHRGIRYQVLACGIGSRRGWALCYSADEPESRFGRPRYWVPL